MKDLTLIVSRFGDLGSYRQCPPFWLPNAALGLPFIQSLREAQVKIIGQSAGGLPIHAIEYGQFEPLDAVSSNLHSSLASKLVPPDPTDIYPASFYGATRRQKPVVVLQGGIHGGEMTGTVASLNLCSIIERGADLRGKQWPRLRELALQLRILIIPWLNPDGVERWPLWVQSGVPQELASVCTQGIKRDGTAYQYPQAKNVQPIPLDTIGFMGCYYNDQGVNLQYDFASIQRQPETTAWMRYYLHEKPDGLILFHCNAGTMFGPPCHYLPIGHQHEVTRIAARIHARLIRDGFDVSRMSWVGLPGLGKAQMDQITATYHVCGGLPILCELPAGTANHPVSCDQMLDIGLVSLEEYFEHALHDGLRPFEYRAKVLRQAALKAAATGAPK